MMNKLKKILINIFAISIFLAISFWFFYNLRKNEIDSFVIPEKVITIEDEIETNIEDSVAEEEISNVDYIDDEIENIYEIEDIIEPLEEEVFVYDTKPIENENIEEEIKEIKEEIDILEQELAELKSTTEETEILMDKSIDTMETASEEIIEDEKFPTEEVIFIELPKEESINEEVKKEEVVKKEVVKTTTTPLIAIVIDDMGVNQGRTNDINKLKYPITSSYLTYSKNLNSQIESSKKAGHEIIAHLPMEAYTSKDAAPDVLKTSMSKKEIRTRLNKMLDKFPDIKGVNNHMGSKFTESATHMDEVIKVLKERNLFFFDSITTNKSSGYKIAEKYNVPSVKRHVFIDNKNELKYILNQLKETEKIAKKNGYAIAIGHPKSQTYEALKKWLPEVEKRGYKLVNISDIIEIIN